MILQHRNMVFLALALFLLAFAFSGCTGVETSAQDGGNNTITITGQAVSPQTQITLSPSPGQGTVTPTPTVPLYPDPPSVSPEPTFSPSPAITASLTPSDAAQDIQPSVSPAAQAEQPSVSPSPSAAPQTASSDTGEKPEFVYPINSFKSKAAVWLTFDDGGNRKAVQKALEVLEQYDLQCTFFVVGDYLKTNKDLWVKAIEQGHRICNHTQSHKWLTDLSSDGARQEILAWEATATEVLGEDYVNKMKSEFPFIRLPGGAGSNSKRVLRIVFELGYTPIGWNLETYYAVLRHYNLNKDPLDEITRNVMNHVTKKASGGSIILLHFNPYDTGRLDEIIEGIQGKGLTFEFSPDLGL